MACIAPQKQDSSKNVKIKWMEKVPYVKACCCTMPKCIYIPTYVYIYIYIHMYIRVYIYNIYICSDVHWRYMFCCASAVCAHSVECFVCTSSPLEFILYTHRMYQGAVTEAAMSWQGKAPCDMPSGEPKSAGNIDVFEIGCASTVVTMMNNNRIIITLLVYITNKQNSNDSFMASACEAIDGIGRDPGHVTILN